MTLQEMLLLEDKAVFGHFIKAATKRNLHYETDGDHYLFIHGTQPYCIVAHIDTVTSIKTKTGRSIESEFGFIRAFTTTSKGTKKRTVLGADDRAGCWILYNMLCNPDISPCVLLTNYEECGGIGVRKFVENKLARTATIKLFIEFDRTGCNEYVEYTKNPSRVHNFMLSYGLRNDGRGSYSDIATISRETNIPAINIACGYYRQHTEEEILDIAACKLALYKATEMLKDLKQNVIDFGTIFVPKPVEAVGESARNFPYPHSQSKAYYTKKEKQNLIRNMLVQKAQPPVKDLCNDCGEALIDCVCGSIISANELALMHQEMQMSLDYVTNKKVIREKSKKKGVLII